MKEELEHTRTQLLEMKKTIQDKGAITEDGTPDVMTVEKVCILFFLVFTSNTFPTCIEKEKQVQPAAATDSDVDVYKAQVSDLKTKIDNLMKV